VLGNWGGGTGGEIKKIRENSVIVKKPLRKIKLEDLAREERMDITRKELKKNLGT